MFKKFTNPNTILEMNNTVKPTTPSTLNSNSSKVVLPTPSGSGSSSSTTPSFGSGTGGSNKVVLPKPNIGNMGGSPSKTNTANDKTTLNNLGSLLGEGYSREMSSLTTKVINEYMDIHDPHTNRILVNLDEAEQNTLLLSLTDRLYKMIVGKIDDVEFGDIPNSKGDITHISKYNQIKECIEILKGIFEQYREDITPIMVIDNALSNIENNSDLFKQCFAVKVNFGIYLYNTLALSVVNGLSYMIAVCIEYIKDPKANGMKIVLDKTGVAKVKDHLVYENLEKFNDSCRQGDLENALRPMIKAKSKGFAISLLGIKTALVVGGVLLALIPIVRDLIYFFYATRARISTYFDIQADLIEMNANELKNNPDYKTEDDKATVIRRQLAVARLFHKVADTIAVEAKVSERKATQEIKQDTKRYKIDEVETDPSGGFGNSSSSSDDGSLF